MKKILSNSSIGVAAIFIAVIKDSTLISSGLSVQGEETGNFFPPHFALLEREIIFLHFFFWY